MISMPLGRFLVACTVLGQSTLAAIISERPSSWCHAQMSDLEYDLCPLFRFSARATSSFRKIGGEGVGESSRRTITSYLIRVGASEREQVIPLSEERQDFQCLEGAWICMQETTSLITKDSSKPPSLASKVIPMASSPQILLRTSSEDNIPNTPLHLRFSGELYENSQQEAEIHFYCAKEVQEPSYPKFAHRIDNTHVFFWRTKHACARPISHLGSTNSVSSDDSNESSTEEPDSAKEDLRPATSSRHWIPSILAISFIIFLLLGYSYVERLRYMDPKASRLRLRLPHAFRTTKSRSHSRFRASDAQLLRWAQEEGVDYDEVDEFVNDVDRRASDVPQLDGEEMPLTPSPRKGQPFGFGAGFYGSVTGPAARAG